MNKTFLALSLVASSAFAASQPLTLSVDSFESVDSAARTALEGIREESKTFEYGGLILTCTDGIRYTEAQTDKDQHHFSLRGGIPKSCAISGIYHSHPGTEKTAGNFSFDDAVIAAHLKVPSYVLVVNSNHMIVLDNSSILATLDKNAQYRGITPSRTL
jgi:hypothetical protein